MNARTPGQPDTGHFHAVRFYENKAALCRTVADFIGDGVGPHQPGLLIATPAHRGGILEELRSRKVDVDALQAAGDLVVLDARAVLSGFMVDAMPDASRFASTLSGVLEEICRGREDCTVRAYGEMVDVLWQDGLTAAAIRLEMLWNQLAATHDFSLLCGYAMGSFYKDAGMRDICSHHSHVIPAESTLAEHSRPVIN